MKPPRARHHAAEPRDVDVAQPVHLAEGQTRHIDAAPVTYTVETWSESRIADGPPPRRPPPATPIGPCSMVKLICCDTPRCIATCGTTYIRDARPQVHGVAGREFLSARRAMTTFSSSGGRAGWNGARTSPLIAGRARPQTPQAPPRRSPPGRRDHHCSRMEGSRGRRAGHLGDDRAARVPGGHRHAKRRQREGIPARARCSRARPRSSLDEGHVDRLPRVERCLFATRVTSSASGARSCFDSCGPLPPRGRQTCRCRPRSRGRGATAAVARIHAKIVPMGRL